MQSKIDLQVKYQKNNGNLFSIELNNILLFLTSIYESIQ